jgi:hypothetical protein
MSLALENLDDVTRKYMLAELDHAEQTSELYLSPRLSPDGRKSYPGLLRDAARDGDDSALEQAIAAPGTLNETETYEREGQPRTRKMNSRAAQTLAEGEFNRLYIRGLCARLCGRRWRR